MTPLDRSPAIPPLLDAGAPLSHRWTRVQAFSHFWTPAPPYHTVGSESRRFPTFGRRRTIITPLHRSPAIPPLLDAGAFLSHRWTRLQAFPRLWAPAHPYHTVGPVSRHFPAFGRRRTRQRTLITPLDPSPCISVLLDAGTPLSHRWIRL
ncbi:hypothetical protein Y032_0012g1876 [Ancylostoma ceylanicum]|uniref:Uncharacterized protein n=1 Tax=Ancylostoma ceylanicum TaxID=53326 RepID=A0A016VEE8_9BILA|nr:hypothetical protein Y032_0012g1876 [Ancylostoma ceylanicum]